MTGRQPAELCDECGYVYGVITRAEIPLALRARSVDFRTRLDNLDDEVVRAHPLSGTWSVLEYACHVRDLFRVQRERVELALVEDEPRFTPMRREERVLEDRYNEQDPTTVGDELVGSAGRLSATFELLDESGWTRTGVYNWPSTQVRTVEWIGQHTVHEAEHHLRDVDRLTAD